MFKMEAKFEVAEYPTLVGCIEDPATDFFIPNPSIS